MKTPASLLTVAAVLVAAQPVLADDTLVCGLRPLPLRGCKAESARCVCDEKGHCQWVFMACEGGKSRPAGSGLVIEHDRPAAPSR